MASIPLGRFFPLQTRQRRVFLPIFCCASTASTPDSLSPSRSGADAAGLNPIVMNGDSPTFVSALGRRIVAGEYGIERMNREVLYWMKGLSMDDHPPFIATRGYDSVVWSRLYSRGEPELEEYQINQIRWFELEMELENLFTLVSRNATITPNRN